MISLPVSNVLYPPKLNSHGPYWKKKTLRPEFVPWAKKLISMNALKINNQMKIFKRGWWKEIDQVIQIISKIGQVTQLAVNYCIRKAVGSLRYTISVSAGAGKRTSLSRSRQSWLSRSADNNAITVIPSSLSVSPVKKQSTSILCCGYGYPYRTRTRTRNKCTLHDQIDDQGLYVILGVQKRAFNR